MDEAYNKHAPRNRSLGNVNVTSMAPVTSRMTPLHVTTDAEVDGFPFHQTSESLHANSNKHHVHFSAPVSPSHTSNLSPITPRRPAIITKSKSHANFSTHNRPSSSKNPRLNAKRPAPLERQDSDWLPRAGAVMANSAREFKGQSWLVSRDSSTSITGLRSDSRFYDEEIIPDIQRSPVESERIGEPRANAKRRNWPASALASPSISRHSSRHHSRNQSRVSFAGLTSMGTEFGMSGKESKEALMPQSMMGPDFVALDDRLEAEELLRESQGMEPTPQDEEAAVRRLIREGVTQSSWINMLMGWKLNADDEADQEEYEDENIDQDKLFDPDRRMVFQRHFEGVSNVPEERVEPPKADEGGWSDAAWLLSVVSKVIL
ncbi:hypothetical protein BROUX41_005190 [Berkeleyomyces rouxiae]|uniref:uncharacterized protein n=1 Tax=Berkeleyomyces rouxiae TaxID=2035830 RepID=UPI003B811FE1